MTRKQIIVLLAAILAVALIIAAGLFFREAPPLEKQTMPETKKVAPPSVEILQGKDFTKDIPTGITPTKPQVEIKVESNNPKETRLGVFGISASEKGYSPDTITVNEHDIVKLKFTSIDGSYDIYSPAMGFHIYAPKGASQVTTFRTLDPGTYLFRCRDHCPSGKTMQGIMVVVPK